MTNQIITLEYDNTPVFFHEDAFINATEIAKKFSKLPKDYLKTSRTKEYIKAIRRIFLMEENQLVKVQNGGTPSEIGTWLHPRLAIDFARWLSADFAVWCDMQIEKILHPDQYGLKQLPEPPTITKAQQGILFNKVVTIAAGRGQIRTQIWSRFQNHFNLSSYKNLPADKFDEALAYLGAKNDEYNKGVEMLYVSNIELDALVDERVKAIEGELLPKKKPSTSVTLTFDGEEHQKFLVNMNPLYTTVSKLAHDELIIRKGDYYLMKKKDEVSVEKLVLDYISAQLLPRLVEVAGQRMGRIKLGQ